MNDPCRYEFWTAERLSDTVAQAFPELVVRSERGATVMFGPVTDQAHLHGLLARMETLGLTVVELRRLPD